MIVIEVKLNGEKISIAGAEDLCVLSAIVNATGKLGPSSRGTKSEDSAYDLSLRVGGLTSRSDGEEDEHPVWVDGRKLTIGDTIIVRVLDMSDGDSPIRSSSAGGNVEEINERKMFEMAKEAYFRLRDKLEPVAR